VTVNTTNAEVYLDGTFAATNFTPANGNNTYTAIAKDTYGRRDTNAITVNYLAQNGYSYDTNGNLLAATNRNFAYDDENQLVSVWMTNVWRSDYAYDGLNRRRISKDYSWNGSSWTQTNEVRYVYDGNLVFQERDGNNLPLVTYTRGNDLSGDFQGAGGIGGLLARSDRMQVIPMIVSINNPHPQYVISSYYHSDGNGNVTALVQPNGYTVASYQYDPYGNMLSMSGLLAGVNKYRFSSKEWNDNAGLYYYGRRFYDPNLQRWVNRDPSEEDGDINLYEFAYGNPMGFVDPYGLDCLGTAANIFAGIGDNITFGLTDKAREGWGWNDGVDKDSTAYKGADRTLTGAQLATGLPGIVKVGGKQILKQLGKQAEKRYSSEKEALVDMAKADKKKGITEADMQAYKDLNKDLKDPFPTDKVRGPERSPEAKSQSSRDSHGHVGPVDHIPIKPDAPSNCTK